MFGVFAVDSPHTFPLNSGWAETEDGNGLPLEPVDLEDMDGDMGIGGGKKFKNYGKKFFSKKVKKTTKTFFKNGKLVGSTTTTSSS